MYVDACLGFYRGMYETHDLQVVSSMIGPCMGVYLRNANGDWGKCTDFPVLEKLELDVQESVVCNG